MPGLLARVMAAGRLLLRDAPAGPADDPRAWWGQWHSMGGGWSQSGQPVNANTARSLPVFSACVSLLSSTLASQRWGVERDLPEGGSEQVSSPADAALAVTDYPTKEKFVADALVYGTAYAAKATDRAGRVQSLAVLPTELVLAQLYADHIDYRYSDPLSCQQTSFAPDDLAILKYRNWSFRPWLGIPPLLTIGDTLGLGLAARSLASSEYRAGTSIKGVLQTAGKLDPQKAGVMRDRWQRAFAGSEAAWQTPVLEEGLSYKEITSRDLAALQLAELSRLNALEVAQAFNVPPSSVGQVEHQSRSTVIDETRRLVSLCLAPLAARVGDAVGQLLLSPQERAQGIRVAINLESLVRGYGLELSEALSRYVLGGIMSRNEARRALGYPGRSDGDELWQPVNQETVQQAQSRQDRADATAEANIAAANSNDAIAAQIDELRREFTPKEPESIPASVRFGGAPKTPAEHLEAAE